MTGRIVWLASYPKSGNTWVRAVVTALTTHRHLFGVNHLGSGAQPYFTGGSLPALGLDSRWLDFDENDRLRNALVSRLGVAVSEGPTKESTAPLLRKTHEAYRPGLPGREPFPREATRAAILIVRDPRDVVCSYAPFFDISLDEAIDAIGRPVPPGHGRPVLCQTAQPWGSWSSHARSWLSADVPFPVNLVRYEDLSEDAAEALWPALSSIALGCTREQLDEAVEMAQFERLKSSEAEMGFRETSPRTRNFFRRGRAAGWKDELSERQVIAVEADHAEMMTSLGYHVTHPITMLAGLAEARESIRRQGADDWTFLPEELGIRVRRGTVPSALPGSRSPRPGIQIADQTALLRFRGGACLLVEGGREVTVEWENVSEDPAADRSWLIQGWAVTLAWLQRGNLSLHAATVRVEDQVVAIAGKRGAGKSTTAMGLRQLGHALLSDDVALIEFRDGEAWTTPYPRNVHLLPDAAERLGLSFDALPKLAGGRNKAAFRPEAPATTPTRLDRIVVIATRPDLVETTMRPLGGGDRLDLLDEHVRRDNVAPMILGSEGYFKALTRLADLVPIDLVERPISNGTIDSVVELVQRRLLNR